MPLCICAHDQIKYFKNKNQKSMLANEGEEVEERQRGRTRGQVCSLHLMMIVIINADDDVKDYRDTDEGDNEYLS